MSSVRLSVAASTRVACLITTFVAAAVFAQVVHIPILLILAIFLVISERFSLKIGPLTHALSLPLIYALAYVSGYPTAILCAVLVILATHLMRKAPWRRVVTAALVWSTALWLADGITTATHASFAAAMPLSTQIVNLVITAASYLLVQGLVHTYALRAWPLQQRTYRPLWQWFLSDTALALLYPGVMIGLSQDPKNTGTGIIGTLFFFLPLAAIAVVAQLIAHLTQAKRRLETLVTVSQAINEQLDLPTVLTRIAEFAHALVQGESSAVYTVTQDGGLALQAITSGTTSLSAHEQAAVACAAEAAPVTLPGDFRRQVAQAMAIPILVERATAGILTVVTRPGMDLGTDELHLLSAFAAHASVALKNARYIEEREQRLLLEERNRLAREIHDGLAQTLASLVLRLEWMKKRALEPRPLEEVQETLQEAVLRVRHSIFSLRPGPYQELGLAAALQSLLKEIEDAHGLQTHLTIKADDELPPAIVETVYHLVTESTRNVIKHAQATNLYVELETVQRQVTLRIRDDGCGFHFGRAVLRAAQERSFGIEFMHTLAEGVSGVLEVLTAEGEGTEIAFTVTIGETIDSDKKTARLSL